MKIYLLYKIMPKEYIPSFANGNFYFSCCGNWRTIAKAGGDKGQGDRYEGVFAKYLKKNSRKPIKIYRKMFGKDLCVENEGEYRLFYRKSALYIPAICFYSIDEKTLKEYLTDDDWNRIDDEWDRIEKINDKTYNKNFIVDRFPVRIPDKYFEEFNINSNDIDAVIIKAKVSKKSEDNYGHNGGIENPSIIQIEDSNKPEDCVEKLMKYENACCGKVKYIDKSKEFDVFADELLKKDYDIKKVKSELDSYMELFYKDKENYGHQCEFRVILPNKSLKSFKNGMSIHLKGLSYGNLKEKRDNPLCINEMDIVCNVKNLVCYMRVCMEKVDQVD